MGMSTVARHSEVRSARRKVRELLRQEWDSKDVSGYRAWPDTLSRKVVIVIDLLLLMFKLMLLFLLIMLLLMLLLLICCFCSC